MGLCRSLSMWKTLVPHHGDRPYPWAFFLFRSRVPRAAVCNAIPVPVTNSMIGQMAVPQPPHSHHHRRRYRQRRVAPRPGQGPFLEGPPPPAWSSASTIIIIIIFRKRSRPTGFRFKYDDYDIIIIIIIFFSFCSFCSRPLLSDYSSSHLVAIVPLPATLSNPSLLSHARDALWRRLVPDLERTPPPQLGVHGHFTPKRIFLLSPSRTPVVGAHCIIWSKTW